MARSKRSKVVRTDPTVDGMIPKAEEDRSKPELAPEAVPHQGTLGRRRTRIQQRRRGR